MFRNITKVLFFSLLLNAGAVNAGEMPEERRGCSQPCPPGKVCPPEECAYVTCFNVMCLFEKKDVQGKTRKCQAASTFSKKVAFDGAELLDESISMNHPRFEVKCDDRLIYNNSSRRFTDLLGTRIQGYAGPYPAIIMPRGELYDGHHYSLAWLELGEETLRGTCYLYTGAALE